MKTKKAWQIEYDKLTVKQLRILRRKCKGGRITIKELVALYEEFAKEYNWTDEIAFDITKKCCMKLKL